MTIGLKANLSGTSGTIQVDGTDVLTLSSDGTISQTFSNDLPTYGSELATVTSSTITLSAPTIFTQNVSVVSGQLYKISWVQTNSVADNGEITVGLGTVNSGIHVYRTVTAASSMEIILTANTTGTVALTFTATVYNASGTIAISGVSCKQVVSTVLPISEEKDELGVVRNQKRITYGGTHNPSISCGNGSLQLNKQDGTNAQTMFSLTSNGESGVSNTANGTSALRFNTTGFNNTANGASALRFNTTGHQNTANGVNALSSNTTGYNNTANGMVALSSNTTGYNNTANGMQALLSNTTGYNNTANGMVALYSNTTGYQNTANGVNALLSNTTGYSNTANGMAALSSNTTGYQNTANGMAALSSYTTTGGTTYTSVTVTNGVPSNSFGLNETNRRIIVQAQSTNGGFVSGTWYTFVWNGTNAVWENGNISGTVTFISNGSSIWINTSGFGYNAQVSGSNQVQLGDSATTTYVYGTVQNRSDLRDKADIRDTVLGLDFVKSLRPVDFKWDLREDYEETVIEQVLDEDGNVVLNENGQPITVTKTIVHDKDGSRKRNRYHHGLIAQELKQTLDENNIDFGGFQDHTIAGGLDRLSIGYDELIGPLIKAIQEQQLIIEQLTSRIEALEV